MNTDIDVFIEAETLPPGAFDLAGMSPIQREYARSLDEGLVQS